MDQAIIKCKTEITHTQLNIYKTVTTGSNLLYCQEMDRIRNPSSLRGSPHQITRLPGGKPRIVKQIFAQINLTFGSPLYYCL